VYGIVVFPRSILFVKTHET